MSAPVKRAKKVVRMVQRPLDELPIVHLEPRVPLRQSWRVTIDGMVDEPVEFSLEQLRAIGREERTWDFHCVWGWSRPACRWEGVPVSRLLALAGPQPLGGYALAKAIEGPYASCFTITEISECLLAWSLDGETLSAEHGGPVRLVPPPRKWQYKGVKWLGAITVIQNFTPGFWEALVGKPHGDIPADMLDLEEE